MCEQKHCYKQKCNYPRACFDFFEITAEYTYNNIRNKARGLDPSPNGFENIFAFTIRIYTIAKNVVIPAINSVLTVVPLSFSLKNFYILYLLYRLYMHCGVEVVF